VNVLSPNPSADGWSIKNIARTLGISKNTIKSYLINLATSKLAIAGATGS
jgi:DNA-binding NarL/FixJ family response regulator